MNYCPTQFFASKRSIVFTFLSSLLLAGAVGEVEFAQGWKFDNVDIKTKDNSQLGVKSSSNMNIAVVK